MAFAILRPYLDDFTDEEIRYAVSSAYSKNNFPERIVNVDSFGSVSFLELFHGQTLTFKDMALSLLPFLMETALKKHPERNKIHILTATSGDTGSAVLSSFRSAENIDVSVLYPEGGIATLQERQMLSFTSKAGRAYALEASNFDDCQRLVKKLLIEKGRAGLFKRQFHQYRPSRPAQIVYYYYAYLALVRDGKIEIRREDRRHRSYGQLRRHFCLLSRQADVVAVRTSYRCLEREQGSDRFLRDWHLRRQSSVC